MPFKNQNTTAYAAHTKPAAGKTPTVHTRPAARKTTTAKTLLAIVLLTAVLAYAGCSGSSTTEVDPSATASTSTTDTDPQPPERTPADQDISQPWVSAGELKDISAELPFDAATKRGQLDNGLRYYIQENANPPGTAHLSLLIRAGSANERDDQRGYAHFLEHMMFNGTKKYPKAELADFLGELGADIGPDVGAYTGYDETGYQLNLPFNDLAKLKQAIEVLHEWARNANIEQEFVDKERGVIEAELRGAQKEGITHLFAGNENTLLNGTPYDNRDPGGVLETIRSATAEGLREFYETWYQPHNMAVVAVGDFDASEIETAIVEQFSGVAKVADPQPSPVAQYHYQPAGNQAVSANYSPQAIDSEAHMSFARPNSYDPSSADAVLDELVSRTVLNILQKRVTADINAGRNPARSIEVTPNLPTTKIKVDTLAVRAEPSQLGEAVAGTIAELERLKRFGVTADELGQIKEELQAEQDQALENLESREHADVLFSLVQHFISGKAHLSGADRHRIYSVVLAQITPEMIQTWVLRQLQFSHPAIVLVGPEEARDVLPTEAFVTNLLTQAADLELEPRQAADPAATATELMPRPEPAEIAAERDLGEGVTELTLANGVKVLHKHSDLAPGKVSISATSPGGEFKLSDDNLIGWGFPIAILYKSGVGELSATQYQAFKADKEYEIDPVITKTRDGFNGVSAVQDLEHALAHVHLTMTNPRVEQQGVDSLVKEVNEFSSFESSSLQEAYNTINRLHYGDSQRFQATPPADVISNLTVDNVRQVIRERFSNAADFTFIFAGDISLADLKDLAQSYLGTLPSTGEQEEVENLERPLPAGVHQHTVTAGPNDSGQVLLRFQAATDYSTLLTHQTTVLRELIETRMFNLLRRELGATYAPQLFINNHYEPAEVTEVQTFIDTAPDQAIEVARQLAAELTGLGETLTREEYDLAISKLESKIALESNEALVENLKRYVEFPGLELQELLNPEQFVEQLNYEDLKALAGKVLPDNHYIQVLVASP